MFYLCVFFSNKQFIQTHLNKFYHVFVLLKLNHMQKCVNVGKDLTSLYFNNIFCKDESTPNVQKQKLEKIEEITFVKNDVNRPCTQQKLRAH